MQNYMTCKLEISFTFHVNPPILFTYIQYAFKADFDTCVLYRSLKFLKIIRIQHNLLLAS